MQEKVFPKLFVIAWGRVKLKFLKNSEPSGIKHFFTRKQNKQQTNKSTTRTSLRTLKNFHQVWTTRSYHQWQTILWPFWWAARCRGRKVKALDTVNHSVFQPHNPAVPGLMEVEPSFRLFMRKIFALPLITQKFTFRLSFKARSWSLCLFSKCNANYQPKHSHS